MFIIGSEAFPITWRETEDLRIRCKIIKAVSLGFRLKMLYLLICERFRFFLTYWLAQFTLKENSSVFFTQIQYAA